jgi:hypothetical protein
MNKKNLLPKIKRTIKSFLKKEDGKMTQEKILITGLFISSISLGIGLQNGVLAAPISCHDCNKIVLDCDYNIQPSYSGNPDKSFFAHANEIESFDFDLSDYSINMEHGHNIDSCHVSHGNHSNY